MRIKTDSYFTTDSTLRHANIETRINLGKFLPLAHKLERSKKCFFLLNKILKEPIFNKEFARKFFLQTFPRWTPSHSVWMCEWVPGHVWESWLGETLFFRMTRLFSLRNVVISSSKEEEVFVHQKSLSFVHSLSLSPFGLLIVTSLYSKFW